MVSAKDIEVGKLIGNLAKELEEKKIVQAPEWSKFVKTGRHKERPPENQNWWPKRAASILRRIHLNGPLGVNRLKTKYGGRKNRGFKPDKVFKASGKIIRTILQQLEKAELISKNEGKKKGRVMTNKGKSFLSKIVKNAK